MKDQFLRSATGGVVKNLNITLVKKVKIPLPPLSIQKEIVLEIENYTKEIEKLDKKIHDKKQKIKDRIAKVWGE